MHMLLSIVTEDVETNFQGRKMKLKGKGKSLNDDWKMKIE